jgi:hypothetical protein
MNSYRTSRLKASFSCSLPRPLSTAQTATPMAFYTGLVPHAERQARGQIQSTRASSALPVPPPRVIWWSATLQTPATAATISMSSRRLRRQSQSSFLSFCGRATTRSGTGLAIPLATGASRHPKMAIRGRCSLSTPTMHLWWQAVSSHGRWKTRPSSSFGSLAEFSATPLVQAVTASMSAVSSFTARSARCNRPTRWKRFARICTREAFNTETHFHWGRSPWPLPHRFFDATSHLLLHTLDTLAEAIATLYSSHSEVYEIVLVDPEYLQNTWLACLPCITQAPSHLPSKQRLGETL